MYYVEFIERDRAMPVAIFRAFADQASSWVEGQADRMVLQLGRTMRLGPHPSYLALWRIADIARLDAWEAYFGADAYRAGNPRSHAMHRAIDITQAGLYDAIVEDGTGRDGLHVVEFSDSSLAAGDLGGWFRDRARARPEAKLGTVLRRVGLLGPDPAHMAFWTFADYAASEGFLRDRPDDGPTRIVERGAYRWLGNEVL
ncbi:MAG: hypothetical protein WD673_04985 [Alphaproteobacteria bacterium]